MDIEGGADSGGAEGAAGGEAESGALEAVAEPAAAEPAAAGPAASAGRLRRAIRSAAGPTSYVVLALLFGFLGGWIAVSVFQNDTPSSQAQAVAADPLQAALLPKQGVTLDVAWGDLPQRLVQQGVIDLDKFKAAAQQAGAPLTADQLKVLTQPSNEPIRIDASNAYFAVDVLWALGLANKNAVLTEGTMAQRGLDKAGSYASTGGWTIGAKTGPEYLAKLDLISLTAEQQAIVQEVAVNSYRPCCANPTAFPDCNHGMAALGLAELMASQGATADQIFVALKQISPFWFPNQYYQVATYFKLQGKEWKDVDARTVMSQQFSSAGGIQQVSAWLQQNGALSGTGTGSGNASSCKS